MFLLVAEEDEVRRAVRGGLTTLLLARVGGGCFRRMCFGDDALGFWGLGLALGCVSKAVSSGERAGQASVRAVSSEAGRRL